LHDLLVSPRPVRRPVVKVGEADGFETIVSRGALWLRASWVTTVLLAGTGSLVAMLGVLAGVVAYVSPLPADSPPSPVPWQGTLVAAAVAALLLRSTARAISALAAGTREIIGTITHAKRLTHRGQRTTYELWHVVVEGQE